MEEEERGNGEGKTGAHEKAHYNVEFGRTILFQCVALQERKTKSVFFVK